MYNGLKYNIKLPIMYNLIKTAQSVKIHLTAYSSLVILSFIYRASALRLNVKKYLVI